MSTTKRILFGAAGVAVSMSMLTMTAPAAHAEDQTVTAVAYFNVSVTDSAEVVTVASADVVGKVNLEQQSPTEQIYKGKCPKVSKVTKKLLKKKCFILKKGKFVNSGINRAGQLVKYTDQANNLKFIYFDGHWRKAKCKNKVWFFVKKFPALTVKMISMVKSFSLVEAIANAIAEGRASATAEVKCVNGNSSASASGTGSGYFKATASASAFGRTEAEARASANGRVAELRTSVRTEAEAKAKAEAKGAAEGNIKVTVTCSDSPPAIPAPKILETTTVNDFVINQEGTITASGTVAPGHTATLFASAKNGGTITANKSRTVSGNFTVIVGYRASTEVGTDQVEFTLTQDDGQSVTKATNVFNIKGRDTTPQKVQPTVETNVTTNE